MHPLKHSMQASIIDPDSIAGPALFGREGRKKKGKILNGEFIIKQGCLGVSKPVAACSMLKKGLDEFIRWGSFLSECDTFCFFLGGTVFESLAVLFMLRHY